MGSDRARRHTESARRKPVGLYVHCEAGIAGLSVAYTLARANRDVVVLDDGLIGRGMTARTTADLVNAI